MRLRARVGLERRLAVGARLCGVREALLQGPAAASRWRRRTRHARESGRGEAAQWAECRGSGGCRGNHELHGFAGGWHHDIHACLGLSLALAVSGLAALRPPQRRPHGCFALDCWLQMRSVHTVKRSKAASLFQHAAEEPVAVSQATSARGRCSPRQGRSDCIRQAWPSHVDAQRSHHSPAGSAQWQHGASNERDSSEGSSVVVPKNAAQSHCVRRCLHH